MYELKGKSSNMETGQGFKQKELVCQAGPSSWSVQLVCLAGLSSWSVQLVPPAGLPSRPVKLISLCPLHYAHFTMHYAQCILHLT